MNRDDMNRSREIEKYDGPLWIFQIVKDPESFSYNLVRYPIYREGADRKLGYLDDKGVAHRVAPLRFDISSLTFITPDDSYANARKWMTKYIYDYISLYEGIVCSIDMI